MKPSISKLLEMLDKPALLKWANKIGLQGIPIDEYQSNSKLNGTDNHLNIENYLKFGILSGNEPFDGKMISFFKDKEIISSETSIENEYFTGRFDVKFKFKDFVFIGDFKSNTKNRIYFETKLQIAAYQMVEKCHVCIIHLPDFIFHPVSIDSLLYEDFLITLSKLYELKQRIEI
jgi:hypothetical protein